MAHRQCGDEQYLQAAIHLGNWLIRQQQPRGAWKETPEDWTGTTADQLLMMACAFPLLEEKLTEEEQINWTVSVASAADYLVRVMNPEFASINYCATTAASLSMANRVVPDSRYRHKAKELARGVVARINEDGLIEGEGGRIRGIKYGVDQGYNLDMSLWGLALYARQADDSTVTQAVRESLKTHQP